jgi:predicted DNA-binding transcriptional regulator AlpA
MEKLLNVKELAELLGLAPASIYHMLDRLPCVRLSRRCVRFRERDIEALLESLSSAGIAARSGEGVTKSPVHHRHMALSKQGETK